jgi:hypothetical protein
MNDRQLEALIKIGAAATQTLIDFLHAAPRDDAERAAQDRAALALVDQAASVGDAIRARLGVPDK